MKDRKEQVSRLTNTVNKIFKRPLACSFRNIYLNPDLSLD